MFKVLTKRSMPLVVINRRELGEHHILINEHHDYDGNLVAEHIVMYGGHDHEE